MCVRDYTSNCYTYDYRTGACLRCYDGYVYTRTASYDHYCYSTGGGWLWWVIGVVILTCVCGGSCCCVKRRRGYLFVESRKNQLNNNVIMENTIVQIDRRPDHVLPTIDQNTGMDNMGNLTNWDTGMQGGSDLDHQGKGR